MKFSEPIVRKRQHPVPNFVAANALMTFIQVRIILFVVFII